jgi:predicted transcriptional regulator
MSASEPTSLAEARDRRAKQVVASALADEAFMAQLRESLAEADRGERAVPLKQLREQERPRRG